MNEYSHTLRHDVTAMKMASKISGFSLVTNDLDASGRVLEKSGMKMSSSFSQGEIN